MEWLKQIPGTSRLDSEWPWSEVNKGQKVKIVFLRITPFKTVVESRDKDYNLTWSILNTIMAVGLTVSMSNRGQRSEVSDNNEIDYNSLKVQFRTV